MKTHDAGPGIAAQIWALLTPQRPRLALIVLLVLTGAGLEVIPPLIVQRVVDGLLSGAGAGLLSAGVIYVLVIVATQTLGFGASYSIALAAQHTLRDLRVRLFAHLQRMPAAYFDKTPLGDMISRCTADVDTIDTLFSSGVANLLTDVARLCVVLAAMFALSTLLTVIAMIGVAPLLILTGVFQRLTREAERVNRRAVGALTTQVQETVGGVEVIRAFGQTRFAQRRLHRALQDTLNAYVRATQVSALYTPIMVIMAAVIVGVLLWAGAQGALSGWGITIGNIAAFVLLFRRFFTPITSLGEEWQTVQSALAGAERVFQVLALPDTAAPGIATPNLPEAAVPAGDAAPGAALIEISHVIFGYAPETPVLNDVSLTVRAGEQVALIGRTGAGKSSLTHLVGGLYAPQSGEVRVRGMDPHAMREDQRARADWLCAADDAIIRRQHLRESVDGRPGHPARRGRARGAPGRRA